MLNKKRFFADFRVHAKFSEALYCPAHKWKATDRSKILDLGSHNSLLQHDCAQLRFQKTLHPNLNIPLKYMFRFRDTEEDPYMVTISIKYVFLKL